MKLSYQQERVKVYRQWLDGWRRQLAGCWDAELAADIADLETHCNRILNDSTYEPPAGMKGTKHQSQVMLPRVSEA